MVSHIVMKLLAKNAEDRYQSASGVHADLERCQQQWGATQTIDTFDLAQHDISDRLHIPQKLYGREDDVTSLLNAFDRVSTGIAELLLVTGPAGVGKSVLVQEVHKPMTAKRGYFAAGKFDQLQRHIPYAAWSQALQEWCHYLLTESPEQLAQWQDRILAAVGKNGRILIEVIPDLARVIGPQPAVAQVGPQEAQHRFQLTFQHFFRAISRPDCPLVLFLDDLHWADAASLRLLKVLMTDTTNHHGLIIGAYRDQEVAASHPLRRLVDDLTAAHVRIEHIALDNLSRHDVGRLIADALEREDIQALTDVVYTKTQGMLFLPPSFSKRCMTTDFSASTRPRTNGDGTLSRSPAAT